MTEIRITRLTWRRLGVAAAIIAVAAALRIWPLSSLGTRTAWLTFYPAVMVAAVYGGLWAGIIAACLSCLTVVFLWPVLAAQPYIKDGADWLGMAVFLMTCSMIAVVAESTRRANSRAVQAQQKAEDANHAKSAFLANMSHELRTPLTAILGFSQLGLRDPGVTAEQREYLTIIYRSGEHLLALINEVLEMAKIESGRNELDNEVFDLHRLIEDLAKMFRARTEAKGLRFTIAGVGTLPRFIIADETKLRVILINLLGNAVKFTARGDVAARFMAGRGPESALFLAVEVEDTGPGIAADEMGKLFMPFVQTESGVVSKSGTGLGLAISQAYVKMMGGVISVSSRVGQGSTFRFQITVREGQAPDSPEPRQMRVVGLEPGQVIPRVLVAEDTEDSRLLLVRLLSSAGLKVRSVANGADAVQACLTWQPHLVWMDIRMPVMDGLEATRAIKSTAAGRTIRVVALSAHVLGDERLAVTAAGCDDFVGKPYQESEIFAVMAKHLGLRYIYEAVAATAAAGPAGASNPLDLRGLTGDLRAELALAADRTDAELVTEVAERVREGQPVLAAALMACADTFDYEAIRAALRAGPQGAEGQ